MDLQQNLQFLERYQPMPNLPDESLMTIYKATTAFFYDHPDPRCISLFLHSFGDWEDWHIYESVQSVLCRFPKEMVLPHLKAGLRSPHYPVRLWCADTVRLFPDESLIPHLDALLKDEEIEIRLVSAAALERIGTLGARATAAHALCHETDEDVRNLLTLV